ncbi:alpha/beta fold hydrolase [Nostoc sp. 2RC]|uniref:alpha/beta fold hydrolase n=1 Tax=Nostoc sp. 2RC TaxID=2485484 RepID=UPI0016254379|nr:alpha/beta hydrolase [Nostoc sp. 2RC]MBC1241237.1 alpha/beta hydrolase [Nostoc sp. 2RC]
MIDDVDVLWIASSEVLQRFDRPLLRYISQNVNVFEWEYCYHKDEGRSIDEAVELVNEFLKDYSHPIHLAGHGAGGAIALSVARRYPQKVRSLVLLAVASQPANTWHVHYYLQRKVFSMSREQVLASSVRHLFGTPTHDTTKKLMAILSRDLEQSPLPHSLFKLVELPQGGVSMPMMVCGSKSDPIVHPSALTKWLQVLKLEDRLWECPNGYHFFHFFYPQEVGEKMLNFWGITRLEKIFNQSLLPQERKN